MRKLDDNPIKVQEIINLMIEKNNKNQAFGVPLLFYPKEQLYCERANRQGAIYWAQMDLRFNLGDIWKLQEQDDGINETVFVKLVLPNGTQDTCVDYLNALSPPITYQHLFPDK